MKKILLTSFDRWLPHQRSNASDDLLAEFQPHCIPGVRLTFLRRLPVEVETASALVVDALRSIRPDAAICCGMAEKRSRLSVESRAEWKSQVQKTTIDLDRLTARLTHTDISHDAGKFVCEGLYFHALHYLQQHQPNCRGLFVHVPILHAGNRSIILEDFKTAIAAICD